MVCLALTSLCRIFTDNTCNCFALLHATPPTYMLDTVQYIMLIGCSGWNSSPALRAVYQVRGSIGHGHRSMYDCMSACIFKLGVAAVGTSIPRTYQSGLGEPLHAYVCDFNNGWIGAKPQEGRSRPKQNPASVLHQEGLSCRSSEVQLLTIAP